MNLGIIARRYAKALVAYCRETGGGEKAFAQARLIVKNFALMPELRSVLDNPVGLDNRQKLDIIATAAGGREQLCDELRRFIELILRHHRINCLPRMIISFIDLWRESQGLKIGLLTTAVPTDTGQDKFLKLAGLDPDSKTEIMTKVNPEIIGGFIFEMDSRRIDASVATQIGKIRKQFVNKNRRIV